jgi:ankyrin repeat protein
MNDKNIELAELIEAVENDALERARTLLEEGCDATSLDEEGRPPLFFLIKSNGSREMAELLIDHGADVHWRNEEGVSLLDEAVERNRADLVKLFIEHGVDPGVTHRKSGMTAMMLAASFDYIDMMELLLEHGADLFAVDSFEMSASDYARRLGRKRAKKWLEEKMANPF